MTFSTQSGGGLASAASLQSVHPDWIRGQNERLAAFFGVPDVRDAAMILRLLPLDPETNLPPAWARGCKSTRNLPRFSRDNERLPFGFDIGALKHPEISRRIAWVVENGSGWWRVSFNGLFFEDETDAFAYRMRWNEPLAVAYSKIVEKC